MSIKLSNIHFAYFEEGKEILPGLTASFDAEHLTVLTGASGCGKSTLLYLAAGLYPHSAGILRNGEIEVEGKEPGALSPRCRAGLVGMMFQNPELQFCMDTVENELIFCLENLQLPPEEITARMEKALDFVGIAELRSRTLNSLSGGERQKAMLACLTALEPQWLLLDEPFANIDDTSARSIAQKLKQLHDERGTGILAVDHRLENWLEIADEVRIMENGLLRPEVLDGHAPDADLLEACGVIVPGRSYLTTGHSELNEKDGFEQAKAEARKKVTPETERLLEEDKTDIGWENDAWKDDRQENDNRENDIRKGDSRENNSRARGRNDGEVVLRLRDLSLSYGKRPILTGVTQDFRAGRIYAIVGPSGCGKSSLFHALLGVCPYRGTAKVLNYDLKRQRRQTVGLIGFVTQSPQDQFVSDTVRQEIEVGLKGRTDAGEQSERILREIRLWRYRDISPYLLSQGQQRRLGVAALMACDCRVLICDEPTYAQDRRSTIAIMENLCAAARERNTALIFSTHDPRLARDYADEILELREGRLIPCEA